MKRVLCQIRPLVAGDWESVKAVYLAGIATGNATFETTAPEWDSWDRNHLPVARLVAVSQDSEVVGWAALTPVSARRVYSGVAEVSVYVTPQWQDKGLGRELLQALISQSEANDIWTLQSSVFPENLATVALHKRCGFRVVGYREKIARDGGDRWRDTLLMERRSKAVGQD